MVNSRDCITFELDKIMKKKLFIGIDVSKNWIDVTMFHEVDVNKTDYQQFDNSVEGFKAMIKWIKLLHKTTKSEMLFCFEHTGIYSFSLCEYLTDNDYFAWVENPLQIKRSLGIKRAKNDKIDSFEIAKYAWRFFDKAKAYTMPSKHINELQNLEALRKRLMKSKLAFSVAANELKHSETNDYIKEKSNLLVAELDKQINEIEKKMQTLIKADEQINEQYKLCLSVPGVGPQTAIFLLIYTRCFTSFENIRQFACYCGLAPFEQTSGSSIKKRSGVSHLANKKLKSLLHLGALNLLRYNKETQLFYERKRKEGKSHNSIMNVIKYKTISRVFAVIKRGENFMDPVTFEVYKRAA